MLMLIFHVENDSYCCSSDLIIEIIPKIPLMPIPQAPEYLVGLLNYGGTPVPVIDFSIIMTGRPCKNRMHTRIILIKNPQEESVRILGLMAEKVIETRELDPQLFKDVNLQIKETPFLNGIYNTENESIRKVNAEQFFETVPFN